MVWHVSHPIAAETDATRVAQIADVTFAGSAHSCLNEKPKTVRIS